MKDYNFIFKVTGEYKISVKATDLYEATTKAWDYCNKANFFDELESVKTTIDKAYITTVTYNNTPIDIEEIKEIEESL